MSLQTVFHIGKGGVGKSTLSALTALGAAGKGQRVLLLSLDPAHNQSDLFEASFADTPRNVHRALDVMEADMEAWIRRYLDEVQQRMRDAYNYLTAINLDRHFRVFRHSPGLEEFALRRVFEHVIAEQDRWDLLVVDMPPTALSTRFFASPTISSAWTTELLALREDIKERREMITRVKLGKKEIETDRVITALSEEQQRNQTLREFFTDSTRCAVRLVINPDPLSWNEGLRVRRALSDLSISLNAVLLNRATDDARTHAQLEDLPHLRIPAIDPAPIGKQALLTLLSRIPDLQPRFPSH
ncbi:ArsA family ATPase [bacterium]|nr:ArsA family ATPase [bacterium]